MIHTVYYYKSIPTKIKKNIINMSIKQKLIISFSIIFCFSLLISSLVFSRIIGSTTKNNVKSYSINYNHQISNMVSTYFLELDNMAYTIMFSTWAQNILRSYTIKTEFELQTSLANATHFLSNVSQMNNEVGIVLIADNGNVVTTSNLNYNYNYDISKESFFDNISTKDATIVHSYIVDYLKQNSNDVECLSLYYKTTSNYSLISNGYLIIHIPLDTIFQNMSDIVYPTLILDDMGNIIYTNINENNRIFSEIKEIDFSTREEVNREYKEDGQKYILTRSTLDEIHWNIVTSMPYEAINQDFTIAIWAMFLLSGIGILILSMAIWLSWYLTIPIIKCKDAILQIRNNQMGIQIKNGYKDEIGELIDGFNEMSKKIVQLIEENKTMEHLKKEAEFAVLQQKVNPHFLYNTLDIINGLILDDQQEEAIKVCETLGKMFRYNLHDIDIIRMKHEFDYIQHYLLIIKYKINDLYITLDVDEEALDAKVFKFILQPIVENCIKHGFELKNRECCLTIKIKKTKEEKIQITIMDNGKGISEEKLKMINEMFRTIQGKNDNNINMKHFGVRNVYQRLFIQYKDKFDFNIHSRINFGTKIEITIPID